ncbi:MAG: type VI secretion system protein TssA [Spongiibacteraceae bacterium]
MNAVTQPNELIYSEAVRALLNPISGNNPAGEDLSFSALFDEIREARRSDDAGLAQGEWETEIKNADWGRVRTLCESALGERTKDLQLAAWYLEALMHLEGFSGFAKGLELFHGLIVNYWDTCYPLVYDGDLDERAGKITWLNTQLPFAVKKIPVTDKKNNSYSWLQWQESRWVENLGQKDAEAKALAINDGKLSGEVFDKAAAQSDRHFGESLARDAQRATILLSALIEVVDNAFGHDAPSLIDLRQTLQDCKLLIDRLYGKSRADMEIKQEESPVVSESSSSFRAPSPGVIATGIKTVGTLNNRADAIQALRDVAQYFRVNEPHSPVALLAARAARWAEMSMEEWLATVVKDDATLGQLRELLDISAPN